MYICICICSFVRPEYVQYRSDARYKFHTRVLPLTAHANVLTIRDKRVCQFVRTRSLLEANVCVSSCKRVRYCRQMQVKMEIAFKAGNVVGIQYAAEQTIIRTIQVVQNKQHLREAG